MSNQTLGRGEVHFSPFKPNSFVPSGFRYFGNTPEFSLTNQVDSLDHYDSDHGIKEMDISVPLQATRSGTFTCDDISFENLGLFFFGSNATIAQVAAAAQTEDFLVVPGLSYQIGLSGIRPTGVHGIGTVVVNKGVTALVAGIDYVVDTDRGIITTLTGGALITGDTITVQYAILARKIDNVISGNMPIAGALQFRSFNPVGLKIDYTMRHVQIRPNGDMSLKGDDWQTIPFTVDILRAPGLQAIYANGQPYAAV